MKESMIYDEKCRVKNLSWKTNKEIVSINYNVFIYSEKELIEDNYY